MEDFIKEFINNNIHDEQKFFNKLLLAFNSGSRLHVNVATDADTDSSGNSEILTDAQKHEIVKRLIESSFSEYVEMIMGSKNFTRGEDFKEYRLSKIISNLYKDSLPGEKEVSQLFVVTNTSGRSLLKNTLTKYSSEMEDTIEAGIKRMLASAKFCDGIFELLILSKYIQELIHSDLEMNFNEQLKPMVRKRETLNVYQISIQSLIYLYHKYELETRIDEIKGEIKDWWYSVFNSAETHSSTEKKITTKSDFFVKKIDEMIKAINEEGGSYEPVNVNGNIVKIQAGAWDAINSWDNEKVCSLLVGQ